MRIPNTDAALAAAQTPPPPPGRTDAQAPAIAAAEAGEGARNDEHRVSESRRQLWASDPVLHRYVGLLEKMFGVHVAILDPADLQANGASEVLVAQAEQVAGGKGLRPELAITMDFTRSGYSGDAVQFTAAGKVTTGEGRSMDLEVTSRVNRDFLTRSAPVEGAGRDDLVLNLDGLPKALKEAKVDFQIGADGTLQRLMISGAGTPYLAWDVNGDGRLDAADQLLPGQNPADEARQAAEAPAASREAGAVYLRLVGGTDAKGDAAPKDGAAPDVPKVDLQA